MKLCKIIKQMAGFTVGNRIQLDDKEAAALVEKKIVVVEDHDYSPTCCELANKIVDGAKKGAKILFLALMFGFAVNAKAGDYTIALSTYGITGVDGLLWLSTARIGTGAYKIEKIEIFNSGNAEQVVTRYKLCTTTSVITADAYVVVNATTTSGAYNKHVQNYSENFNNPLTITAPCWRKSDAGSTVYLNVHYR